MSGLVFLLIYQALLTVSVSQLKLTLDTLQITKWHPVLAPIKLDKNKAYRHVSTTVVIKHWESLSAKRFVVWGSL